jgi:hypothetical protein
MVLGVVAASVVLLLLARLVLAGDDASAACRSTLVPAYVGPAELQALVERSRRSSSRPPLVVLNPASGPGSRRDPAYAAAIAAARENGVRVLGYVATGYGDRPAADVAADVDRYGGWYGVDGIFLDETAHTPALVDHYRELAAHARGEAARLVVVNPGMVPARGYFDLADIVVTFEGTPGDYAAALARAPDWLAALPADRIAHLLYAATREQAMTAVGAGAHAGYVYVTSGTLPNPWLTVPDYLDEEESLLAACGGT